MATIAQLPSVNLFGYNFQITASLITQWVIVLVLILLIAFINRNLKKIPDKKQSVVEIFVEFVQKTIEETMGKNFKAFVPFIGTLGIYLLSMNLVGILGIKPPTTDYSVTLGMSLITFIVIQGYTIKKSGVIQYFTGYAKPLPLLLPVNIMERIMLPVSLSLRLFGNMFAATIIMELVYSALNSVTWVAQLGIPIPLHMYFDLFDGTIQMIIFVMLTMINIVITSEE
ncbi:F0F1 ATP synthase subunit A [Clostridium sp. CM028]|uniref:F0F1 ATP synthase subunit A n=1 Tax=Clostridium TaxID=1485 RepID=UPI0013EEADFD|nr:MULTISPECIES: F0F1 ATP synthase subunit A [Clostridium]MBU3092559.1 F0F1 ATP synthase subunit A [Clostridium sp. CF011]MBW9146240.1 F0F1 ATP synthase subunit A [Clostridium sp. CM027]MBW9149712.1 F0F1 ATP synthase subunit A [Clostridium sp. CM028]MBZ9606397.1 F0F1 ATP synthase subunit A [Clostridium estertheticum]UVE39781.1 F0F1 ATP synthase subunit A [Clostridium sp. CM027]